MPSGSLSLSLPPASARFPGGVVGGVGEGTSGQRSEGRVGEETKTGGRENGACRMGPLFSLSSAAFAFCLARRGCTCRLYTLRGGRREGNRVRDTVKGVRGWGKGDSPEGAFRTH